MGRTSKPLTFVIEASIDGPVFDALREQGHTVVRFTDENQPVFGLFGPRCWRMDKSVASNPKLFQAALKNMREIYDGLQNQETNPGQDTQKPTKVVKRGQSRANTVHQVSGRGADMPTRTIVPKAESRPVTTQRPEDTGNRQQTVMEF